MTYEAHSRCAICFHPFRNHLERGCLGNMGKCDCPGFEEAT